MNEVLLGVQLEKPSLDAELVMATANNLKLAPRQHCGKPFISGGKPIYCDRIANDKGDMYRTLGPLRYTRPMARLPLDEFKAWLGNKR